MKSLRLVLSHHIHFVGPPERADVSKLLHHALQVYIDYSSQHSLKKPAYTHTICLYISLKIDTLSYSWIKHRYLWILMQGPHKGWFRVLTFGSSSKSSPIFNKITRITTAEIAPATWENDRERAFNLTFHPKNNNLSNSPSISPELASERMVEKEVMSDCSLLKFSPVTSPLCWPAPCCET